jgi:hypothetical protein
VRKRVRECVSEWVRKRERERERVRSPDSLVYFLLDRFNLKGGFPPLLQGRGLQ